MRSRGKPTIVTAAVIERDERLLVTRRVEGSHLAGYWEFPGGKCEAGESAPRCLAREILEELGAEAQVHDEIFRTTYQYEDSFLELRFFACSLSGPPRPLLRQEIRWVSRDQLRELRFPPADAELIEMLTRT